MNISAMCTKSITKEFMKESINIYLKKLIVIQPFMKKLINYNNQILSLDNHNYSLKQNKREIWVKPMLNEELLDCSIQFSLMINVVSYLKQTWPISKFYLKTFNSNK
jgi:hypothetical protein